MTTRTFSDWDRVVSKDGARHGVIGNYNVDLRMYAVLWDDNGWDYVELHEIKKEDE